MAGRDLAREGFDRRRGEKAFFGHQRAGCIAPVEEGDRVALFWGGGVLLVAVTGILRGGRFRGRVVESWEIGDAGLCAGADVSFGEGHIHVCWKRGARA